MGSQRITYKELNELLAALGFEAKEVTTKNNCIWRHPEVGTTVVLPANKLEEPALHADILPMRVRLDYDGHLDTSEFDAFVAQRKLPHID